MTTKSKAPVASLQQRFSDAFTKKDKKALGAIYSADAVVYDPMYPQPLNGRTAVEKDFADFIAAFPDLSLKIIRFWVQGEWNAAEFQMIGTNKGPLIGPDGTVPATNRRMDSRGVAVARTNSAGLVVEERRYYDMAALANQLGLEK